MVRDQELDQCCDSILGFEIRVAEFPKEGLFLWDKQYAQIKTLLSRKILMERGLLNVVIVAASTIGRVLTRGKPRAVTNVADDHSSLRTTSGWRSGTIRGPVVSPTTIDSDSNSILALIRILIELFGDTPHPQRRGMPRTPAGRDRPAPPSPEVINRQLRKILWLACSLVLLLLIIRWLLAPSTTRTATTQMTNIQAVQTIAGQSVAVKPSFDCVRARTSTEKMICQDSDLASQERAMAAAYHLRLNRLNPVEVKMLRREHARWFHAYQKRCNPLIGNDLKKCIATLLSDHTHELDAWTPTSESSGTQLNSHSAASSSLTGNHNLTDFGCSGETYQKSIGHAEPVNINFMNNTSATRQVIWLDYEGRRVFYKALSAGESYVQGTFVTHRWIIADQDYSCRQLFVVESAVETTAVIDR